MNLCNNVKFYQITGAILQLINLVESDAIHSLPFTTLMYYQNRLLTERNKLERCMYYGTGVPEVIQEDIKKEMEKIDTALESVQSEMEIKSKNSCKEKGYSTSFSCLHKRLQLINKL